MRPLLLAFAMFALSPGVLWAVEAQVELELVTDARVPPTASQQWMRTLGEAGFDRVRIGRQRGGQAVEIESLGSPQSPRYRVTGRLTGGGSIQLPGGRFTARDAARIRAWVADLKTNGPPRPGRAEAEFGLTVEQFEAVQKDLSGKIDFETAGADPADVITTISRRLNGSIVIEPAARRAIVASGAVRESLAGLSYGSALAAVIRPAGCAMQPRREGARVVYQVTGSPEGHIWPIGWPSQETDGRLIPNLLKRETLQSVELPLATGLRELQQRVGVPFLLDHNNLARQQIDPATAKVKMEAGRAHYASVLKTILFQAGLKYEARVDEAGDPLLWITTIRQ